MRKEFFSFDTVENFDEHIKAQILEYSELDSLVKEIFVNFYEDNSCVYDLGCSTGRMLRELKDAYPSKRIDWIGVENNENFTKNHASEPHLIFKNEDVRDTDIQNASVVLSIFTLQFLPPEDRGTVIRRVYEGLRKGGAFIFSEKIYSSSARIHKILEMRHWDIKRKKYSDTEVMADERDLRDVMKPQTYATIVQELRGAGFTEFEVIWRFNNFIAFLCIK